MPDPPLTLNVCWMYAIANVRSSPARARWADTAARDARAEMRDYALGARRLGMTLAQIGQAIGVSRQRVHELTR